VPVALAIEAICPDNKYLPAIGIVNCPVVLFNEIPPTLVVGVAEYPVIVVTVPLGIVVEPDGIAVPPVGIDVTVEAVVMYVMFGHGEHSGGNGHRGGQDALYGSQ